jgi:hypothetical protein
LELMRRKGLDWVAAATERHWRSGETYYIDDRVNAKGIRRLFNKCNAEVEENKTYRTFIRSCRNWEEFASARKLTKARGLSWSQAKQRCEEYNAHLSARQRRKGTKMEFEAE